MKFSASSWTSAIELITGMKTGDLINTFPAQLHQQLVGQIQELVVVSEVRQYLRMGQQRRLQRGFLIEQLNFRLQREKQLLFGQSPAWPRYVPDFSRVAAWQTGTGSVSITMPSSQ